MNTISLAAVVLFSLAASVRAEQGQAFWSGFGAINLQAVRQAVEVSAPSSPEYHLKGGDTSGCSVQEQRRQSGQVYIAANPVPGRNCWNLLDSGFLAEYKWIQPGPATSGLQIGFWVSFNGKAHYLPASAYKCEPAANYGYGADTSGQISYVCTASARFSVRNSPELFSYAYNQAGQRNAWDLQVAVSLGNNSWDSLSGSNHRFSF